MYFSTTNKNVEIKYNYFEKINFTNSDLINLKIKIGEVIIKNNNFLPSKIYLKKLKACNGGKTYFIEYINSENDYNKVFFNREDQKFVEVSSKSNKKISIIITVIDKPYLVKPKKQINKTYINLYLYEDKNFNNYFNFDFCLDVNRLNSIKKIKMNLNS